MLLVLAVVFLLGVYTRDIFEKKPILADTSDEVGTREVDSAVPNGQDTDSGGESVDRSGVEAPEKLYSVLSVIDGDTFKVDLDGVVTTLRLIGIDTPEKGDCYGTEATAKAKELLSGKRVKLEVDPSQGELDKYKRTLRYVFLEDGRSYNKIMIEEGFAKEYTYASTYKYQAEFRQSEESAKIKQLGLWSPNTCNGGIMAVTPVNSSPVLPEATSDTQKVESPANTPSNCQIKGNISSSGKIYHMPGGAFYDRTNIDESDGERWFCSEEEAIAAGWRKSSR